jgi:hypothetical protein
MAQLVCIRTYCYYLRERMTEPRCRAAVGSMMNRSRGVCLQHPRLCKMAIKQPSTITSDGNYQISSRLCAFLSWMQCGGLLRYHICPAPTPTDPLPHPFPDHKTQDIFKGRCRRELQTIMHTCVCFVFCQASDLQNCISVLPATTTATTALPGHQKIPLNWQKLT